MLPRKCEKCVDHQTPESAKEEVHRSENSVDRASRGSQSGDSTSERQEGQDSDDDQTLGQGHSGCKCQFPNRNGESRVEENRRDSREVPYPVSFHHLCRTSALRLEGAAAAPE